MLNLDNNMTNSDWLRSRSWDLSFDDLAGFVKFQGLGEAPSVVIDIAIRKFMALPAYKAAPESLVRDFASFLSGDMVMKEWDESRVERDENGRFASGGGGDSSSTVGVPARSLADPIASRAREIEPKLTRDMQRIAERVGGELRGLNFRLKTEESLTRKIEADAKDKYPNDPNGMAKAAAEISDANRYTMVASQDAYTDSVDNALTEMTNIGYDVTNAKNYWVEGNNYKGINVAMLSPEGDRVELQFHTPESLELKESSNHALYEAWRVIDDKESVDAQVLNSQMIANASSLVTPPRVENLGTMKMSKEREVLSWT